MRCFRLCSAAFCLLQLLAYALCFEPQGTVTVLLQHGSISVRASSLNQHSGVGQRVVSAVAAAAVATPEELREASDFVFHKAKYATPGSISLSADSTAAISPIYARKLETIDGDQQFFVQFATATDSLTLLAFHKATGRPIVAHVQGNLFIAIAHAAFDSVAMQFPGVLWVQSRDDASKLSAELKFILEGANQAARDVEVLVAECWIDGCFSAALAARKICPGVYVHPTVIEVVCPAASLAGAVAALVQHVAVDHVDVKHAVTTTNFGGRTIISAGPDAIPSSPTRILSSISMANSVIGLADSGVDMNNCMFYDSNATASPWNNSRVVKYYDIQPCANCGKCCVPGISAPTCSNEVNACGNYRDESAHGTHVCGTIAGQGPAPVDYANGVANGSKIFFSDIENFLNDSACYKPGECGFSGFADAINLYSPALAAGA